jgi:hypothetical protein
LLQGFLGKPGSDPSRFQSIRGLPPGWGLRRN